jgi:hypothetical protein
MVVSFTLEVNHMSFLAAVPIIGDIIKGATQIISKAVTDKDKAAELAHEIQKLGLNAETDLLKLEHEERIKQLEAQKDVIVAEATGEGFLQRNWRPGIMCLFGIIIANNYILHPWLKMLCGFDVMMPIPPEMWSLLQLGISGYIVSRGVEKGIDKWKK